MRTRWLGFAMRVQISVKVRRAASELVDLWLHRQEAGSSLRSEWKCGKEKAETEAIADYGSKLILIVKREYAFFVYILSSRSRNLYVGLTTQLRVRVGQHREKRTGTHTARYNIVVVECHKG